VPAEKFRRQTYFSSVNLPGKNNKHKPSTTALAHTVSMCNNHKISAHTEDILPKFFNQKCADRHIKLKGEKIQGGSNMTGTNCDLFTHK
jgi:hypothetical protein